MTGFFSVSVIGPSRPEASHCRAETEGDGCGSGERNSGKTKRGSGQGQRENKQHCCETQNTCPGSGGFQQGKLAPHWPLCIGVGLLCTCGVCSIQYTWHMVFAACCREVRGGRASLAGGSTCGVWARGEAQKYPFPNRAAEAARATHPSGVLLFRLCFYTTKL